MSSHRPPLAGGMPPGRQSPQPPPPVRRRSSTSPTNESQLPPSNRPRARSYDVPSDTQRRRQSFEAQERQYEQRNSLSQGQQQQHVPNKLPLTSSHQQQPQQPPPSPSPSNRRRVYSHEYRVPTPNDPKDQQHILPVDNGSPEKKGAGENAPLLGTGTLSLVAPYGSSQQRSFHEDNSNNDADSTVGSVLSRQSSVKILPWAFQNVSGSLVPSETELVDVESAGGDSDGSLEEFTDEDYDAEGEGGQVEKEDDDMEMTDHAVFHGRGGGAHLPPRSPYRSRGAEPPPPPVPAEISSPVMTHRHGSSRSGVRSNGSGGGGGLPPPPAGGLPSFSPSPGRRMHPQPYVPALYSTQAILPPVPHLHPHHNHHHHHHRVRVRRSLKRRIFLLLTEPQTSVFSAIFFVILILVIAMSNVVMMMQTMDQWQFIPDDCISCGGTVSYKFEDDTPIVEDDSIPCVCPPAPLPIIVDLEDWMIYFFSVEWTLRVLCFEPPRSEMKRGWGFFLQWFAFLTETTTILDALAIFPYYLERFEKTNGLLSLRLLRLFRVFQLVRLGQYNVTFMSLTNVLVQSILSFNLLIIVLLFGAAFFGSMMYWLEKGDWKYTNYTDPPSYMFVRIGADGVTEEPSPFTSIPASFWWFIVTATTVGYGDTYPTTMGGKCVATFAMLTGVLVIAFPVSVFSDLWSKELKKAGALTALDDLESSEGDDGVEATERKGKSLYPGSASYAENASFGVSEGPASLAVPEPFQEHATTNVAADEARRKEEPPSTKTAITLTPDEVEAIHAHMKIIDESQRKIRGILRSRNVVVSNGADKIVADDAEQMPSDKSLGASAGKESRS